MTNQTKYNENYMRTQYQLEIETYSPRVLNSNIFRDSPKNHQADTKKNDASTSKGAGKKKTLTLLT